MPEHPAVDAEEVIADFVTLGPLELFVSLFPDLLQRFNRCANQHIHCHVAATTEGWLELLHDQKDFAIVGAGIVGGLDVNRPRLAGVGAAAEVVLWDDMRMIETKSGGFRYERETLHSVRGYERRAFLCCAVDIARYYQTMHMDELGRVRFIVDLDDDAPALPETQQRSRKLAVVERGRDNVIRRQLDQSRPDAQRVVRLLRSAFVGGRYEARHRADKGNQSGIFDKGAPIDHHGFTPLAFARKHGIQRPCASRRSPAR